MLFGFSEFSITSQINKGFSNRIKYCFYPIQVDDEDDIEQGCREVICISRAPGG